MLRLKKNDQFLDCIQTEAANKAAKKKTFFFPIPSENSRPSSLPARVAFREKDVCDLPPTLLSRIWSWALIGSIGNCA